MNELSAEGRARVLIVLDDPVLIGLISGTLRSDGLDVGVIANPSEALRIGKQEFQDIDLVITRIKNQPVSGLEFAKRLAQRKIHLPMLFMSGSHSLAAVVANSLGSSAVLEEPFTAAALRNAVRRCLTGRRRAADKPRSQPAASE